MVQTLVVDDSAVNRKVLRRLLQAAGCAVVEASCGQTAFEACQASSPFALILMDLNMPKMDGWQATERIRHLEHARGQGAAFIVAVTSEDISEGSAALHKCWQAGMDAVMGKCVTKQDVDELLQCALACSVATAGNCGQPSADSASEDTGTPLSRNSLEAESDHLSGRLEQLLCSAS